MGKGFWRGGDQTLIDGLMVNGSARVVGWFSGVVRLVQSGLVNQYAVAMLIGVLILGILDNGLTQMSVDSYVRDVLVGAIILAAVASGALSRR